MEIDLTSILVTNTNSDNLILLNAQKIESVDILRILKEHLFELAIHDYYKVASLNVGHVGSEFYIGQQNLFVQKSLVEASAEFVASTLHRAHILYLAHHSPILGHSEKRRAYGMLRRT